MGIIDAPEMDGLSIAYLKSAPVVLAIFTFQRELIDPPQGLQAPGFAFAELVGAADRAVAGKRGSGLVHVDSDGFPFSLSLQ